MKLKSLYPALLMLLISIPFRSSAEMKFQALTVEQALEAGKKENKMVFVYFSSNQCPSCRIMESQVFIDQTLADFVNKNYITIRSSASNIEGRMEQYQYQINMYPTIIYFDPTKGELMRLEGKKSLEIVKKASIDVLKGVFTLGDKKESIPSRDTTLIKVKGSIVKPEE